MGCCFPVLVSRSRKKGLEEPRSYQKQRMPPSSLTYPTGWARVDMKLCPFSHTARTKLWERNILPRLLFSFLLLPPSVQDEAAGHEETTS